MLASKLHLSSPYKREEKNAASSPLDKGRIERGGKYLIIA
jgi:hypothetical protein